jgi:phosphatidylserine/phosphatidylglycerophosphate/cardiolipin synthase-like enzyme
VDLDVLVCGAAAAEACRYFQGVWESNKVGPTDTSNYPWPELGQIRPRRLNDQDLEASHRPRIALDSAVCGLCGKQYVQLNTPSDWTAGALDVADVRFLCDPVGCKHQRGAISERILALLAAAQHSIILESPYLVLSARLETILCSARKRGVRVVILTNSLASTDHIVVYGGYANQKPKLLAKGIELWEFAGPSHLHAKAAVIDGCISVIGSTNFDPRGEHFNTETAIVAYDPNFAACLTQLMAAHFAAAWPIGADGMPTRARHTHPSTTKSRRLKMHTARLIAPLIEKQL